MTTTAENDKFSDGVCCSADAKNTIKQMLDFTLLKDPIFILYTISNFLTSIGFNIPYLYLVVSIGLTVLTLILQWRNFIVVFTFRLKTLVRRSYRAR